MVQRFETFVTSITQIYRCIQKMKTQEMADFGLKGTHVMCLFHLSQHSEGLTGAQLAQYCEEDKAAISRIVSELKERGLVVVPENPGQRRYRAAITLTEEGVAISRQMGQKIIGAVGVAAQGYTEEERDTFYHVLLQVAENLQAAASKEEK